MLKHFKIGYPQLEQSLAVRPSALFNLLQDVASDDAQRLDFGYSAITEKKLMWFLLKYRMEFSEYPTGVDELAIHTEPRGFQKLFAYRDFEITARGRTLGRIASAWATVDIENGGFVSPQVFESPHMQPFKRREGDLLFSKIPQIQRIDAEKNFEIRYEDIDVNGHVNNINYFIWAFEALDVDFRTKYRLKTLDVVFKKEVKYGNLITSKMSHESENTTLHTIQNATTGEDLCHMCANWA
jgi:medium-chain acyl-[acyl-carrier-protein] hydrolase